MLEVDLRFISVGGGNILCSSKIITILPAGNRMSDGMMRSAKKTKRFMALTNGHKARSYILLDNGLLVSSRLRAMTLYKRLNSYAPDPDAIQYKKDNKEETYRFEEDKGPDELQDINVVTGPDPDADEFEDGDEDEEELEEEDLELPEVGGEEKKEE